MSIVYIIGAGINQVIKHDWFDKLTPPLINNFFQVASRIPLLNDDQCVYDYIYKYWKKDRSALSNNSINLEEVFTLLELQLREARERDDSKEVEMLSDIYFKLKILLLKVLQQFSSWANQSPLVTFGKLLLNEEPTVITFNYDDFVETALETASGLNESRAPIEAMNNRYKEIKKTMDAGEYEAAKSTELSDEEIKYHFFNWDRVLGYGMEFDIVGRNFPGVEEFAEGKRFYSSNNNKLYSWHLLKLHGSIHWFRYLDYPAFHKPGEPTPSLSAEKKKQIILSRRGYWGRSNLPPDLNGWFLDPIIITPALYKDSQLNLDVFNKLKRLWILARNALSMCKKLVVIGYSFPATDFLTRKLFLEAFSDNKLEELVIVNPDTSVVQMVRDLCHYNRPVVVCKDLGEYLRHRNL